MQGYTRQPQAELERVFTAQYQLTLTEEVEVRYLTETRTDSEGNSHTVEVPYNYYILNVTLTSKPISAVATELLTPDQLEMYQVYRTTLGNKPLIFGGGSTNTSDSESLEGVEFINGTRPGNPEWWNLPKVRWVMWVDIPTGAGTASIPCGMVRLLRVLVLRPEVCLNRALQAVSLKAFPVFNLMDNGGAGPWQSGPR